MLVGLMTGLPTLLGDKATDVLNRLLFGEPYTFAPGVTPRSDVSDRRLTAA
jgi:hypothetical protein